MQLAGRVEIASAAVWIPEDHEVPVPSDGRGVVDFGLPLVALKSLPVSKELAPPEMAVLAAKACLLNAGCDPSELRAIYHSHLYHQGHDYWSAAHFVARELGTGAHTTPVTVQQSCNGAMMSIQLASAALLAGHDTGPILLTTADRFIDPGWQRWVHAGTGLASGFGDGATALLLRRRDGTPAMMSILSVNLVSDPSLEVMYRGEEEFTPVVRWQKERHFQDGTVDATDLIESSLRSREFVRLCLDDALADAGVSGSDERIRYVCLPRGDAVAVGAMYCDAFDDLPNAEVVMFGEHTGHIGPGDPVANIVELRDRGMLRQGEIVVLVASGAGTTWSTTVVEAGPAW